LFNVRQGPFIAIAGELLIERFERDLLVLRFDKLAFKYTQLNQCFPGTFLSLRGEEAAFLVYTLKIRKTLAEILLHIVDAVPGFKPLRGCKNNGRDGENHAGVDVATPPGEPGSRLLCGSRFLFVIIGHALSLAEPFN